MGQKCKHVMSAEAEMAVWPQKSLGLFSSILFPAPVVAGRVFRSRNYHLEVLPALFTLPSFPSFFFPLTGSRNYVLFLFPFFFFSFFASSSFLQLSELNSESERVRVTSLSSHNIQDTGPVKAKSTFTLMKHVYSTMY